MKKIMVIFLLTLCASAEWQQREEITLPKSILVNDIGIGSDGRILILTRSSISQIDDNTKNLVLISEINNGKIFASAGDEIYVIDNNNRLLTLNQEGTFRILPVKLINPGQINIIKIDKKKIIIIGDGNRLIFTDGNDINNVLNTPLTRFSMPKYIENERVEVSIFTMSNNQIYAWTGGSFSESGNFKGRLIYSASEQILDFTTDADGKLYVLFQDSIAILKNNGEYEDKILIEKFRFGSRIFVYPMENNLLLFNSTDKTFKILSKTSKTKNDIIILNKNRPNPVENYTELEFTINEPMSITLIIYNLIGKVVKVIANGYYNRGTHTIPWHADDENGNPVPNGVYFYRLETKKGVLIKQLIVLR